MQEVITPDQAELVYDPWTIQMVEHMYSMIVWIGVLNTILLVGVFLLLLVRQVQLGKRDDPEDSATGERESSRPSR